ncbi:hypothetical protein ES708_23659 [subsurface metagenome]
MEIKIYTVAPVCTGYINVPLRRRLLDVLNGVPIGELRTSEEFLPVSEARISSSDGSELTAQNAYLNRAKILFVKEVGGEETKEPGGEVVPRKYPFIEKLSAPVKLLMPFFTLTGRMYYAKNQHLRDMLNSKPRFLPLTNVAIYPAEGESESGVSFVAVNKEQIISLEEGGDEALV